MDLDPTFGEKLSQQCLPLNRPQYIEVKQGEKSEIQNKNRLKATFSRVLFDQSVRNGEEKNSLPI